MLGTGTPRGRRCSLALATVAAGATVLSACTPAAPPLQVSAAAAAMPASPWTDAAPWPVAGYPDLVVAPVPGGLQVPQPPRPLSPGRVLAPLAARGAAPSLTPPTAACGGFRSPRAIVPGVVPAVGAATVTWPAGDTAAVRGYRVSAVSQQLVPGTQPPVRQQTVAQPARCGPVSVTMTGLTPRTPYVFWLEEEVTDLRTGVVRFVQLGSSAAVVTGG